MALIGIHKQTNQQGETHETKFGVGDTVRVHQRIVESGKTRVAIFEGMVIAIRGAAPSTSFVVRRIGEASVGIEQIFPLFSPNIEKIEVKRSGTAGVRQAKLYFTRDKSKREIEKIYSRSNRRNRVNEQSKPKVKKTASKKVAKKSKKA